MFSSPVNYVEDALVLVMTAVIFLAFIYLYMKGSLQMSAVQTGLETSNHVVDPLLSQTGYLPSCVGPSGIPTFGCVDALGNPAGYLPASQDH